MTAEIIDGKAIAATIRQEIAERVDKFYRWTAIRPHLAAVLTGDNPAGEVYVRNKRSACEKAGIASSLYRLHEDVSTRDMIELLEKLNNDQTVHGILVQLPLPRHVNEQMVLSAVNPAKDVDGFHPENVGLLSQGSPRFVPCTPAGIAELLLRSGVAPAGKHVVIIGRSNIVGRPLANLLLGRDERGNATVTVCHSQTADLASHVRRADIVVAAIGKPKFITGAMIKPGAVVIDVGINRIAEGAIVGDVDFESAASVASRITPVPGGVGPMTIAMVLENTLRAANLNDAHSD